MHGPSDPPHQRKDPPVRKTHAILVIGAAICACGIHSLRYQASISCCITRRTHVHWSLTKCQADADKIKTMRLVETPCLGEGRRQCWLTNTINIVPIITGYLSCPFFAALSSIAHPAGAFRTDEHAVRCACAQLIEKCLHNGGGGGDFGRTWPTKARLGRRKAV